ncbi:hypothetical protein [uncultured Algibacter sp.]|uniref:hypothetical protein n=1 Tax=uncultured Algibacter sp. TaxID=298659 RepID=UPI00261A5175|nr:hypothetical protein [uncultured Algibacter sp.]
MIHLNSINIESEILDINQLYDHLVLTKEEGMVIYILDSRIKLGKISKYFTYRDIEKCINESAKIEVGSIPQTEKIVRNLLHFYIERPPNEELKFALTNYAKKFIDLIHKKLHSPLKHFPLKKTFQKYADFKSSTIETIADFELWYDLQFHNNSKQTIIDHLEALKDVVNSSISRLNDLLKNESEDLLTITKEFTLIFDEIGLKSEEIKYTLRLGNTLNIEIEKVVDLFYKEIDEFKHPENSIEQEKFEKLNDDYKKALHIKTEVTDFFYDVDYRLKQLMDKSLYANGQLTNLQNSFRNQSRIRINLKKLLKFTLEQASYSNKHIITLPKSFPIKSIPVERFKFIEVPYYHTYGIQRNEILPAHYDNEYARSEREKVEKDLFRQENAAKLLREYKSILEEEKELNFTEHFYKILESENDSEIALSVGFDLFQFANRNPRYQIEITKDLPEAYSKQKILVWNMKINQIP